MEPQIRYCTTEDGVSIAYQIVGSGPPLVITPHQLWSHVDMEWKHEPWRRGLEGLTAFRTVVRYDHRGVGMSDRAALDFSLDALVRDLEAVVSAACPDRQFALLGTGHGGPEAIRYAARHPDRVSHLILHSTYACGADFVSVPFYAGMYAMASEIRDRDFSLLGRTMASVAGADPAWFAEYLRAGCTPRALGLAAEARKAFDVRPELPLVQCPTLVIHGEWPGNSPEERQLSASLAAGIPDARLEIVARYAGDGWIPMPDLSQVLRRFFGAAIDVGDREPTRSVRVILFTDLVDHAEMMRRLGDTRGRELLREHEQITRRVLQQHGGQEIKTLGDGFMASFTSVTGAMECAIGLQRAFAERNQSATEPLAIRVGLNAGEPIEEEGDLFGATVILASRIVSKAAGGEILVADTVRGLCSGKGFLFSDRGDFVAKGFEEPVRVYEVSWQG